MKTEAMVLERHGGPEVLERRTVEIEGPGPREVLVRVRAVAMNHMDLWVRRGGPHFRLEYPWQRHYKCSPASSASGLILAILR